MAQTTLTRPKISKTCEVCSGEFFVYPYRADTARFCNHACYATTVHAQKKTEKWYEVMTGRIPWNKGLKGWTEGTGAGFQKGNALQKGEKNVNWKGGITPLYRAIRESRKYWDWRTSIFQRDSHTCQLCGSTKSNQLNADHYPRSFAEILRDGEIKTLDGAMAHEGLWSLDIARTLCVPCHKKTPNYGRKGVLPRYFRLPVSQTL